MTKRFFILPVALTTMLLACGGDPSTEGELTVDAIESRLESPTDYYTMDAESIADDLLAFPELSPQEAEALALEIASFDLTENPDVLGETAAPSTGDATEPPPPTDAPNAPPSGELEPCPHGLIKGQWKHVKNGFGVFRGAFLAPGGELLGYVRGVYGRHRVVGKVVTKDGQPHSLMMGVYGASFFRARLITRDGIEGALGGRYADNVFIGKWRIFCNKPDLACPPAMMPHPTGLFCVPRACVPGSCPVGFYCDLCPSICKDAIADGANACAAVCGQPVCRPRVVLPKPGEGPQCAEVMLGGALSCKPTDVWKKYAEGLCTAKGGVLAAFGVGLPCGDDAYHVTRLICCRPPQADASLPTEPTPDAPPSSDPSVN